ncbi:hypothetical protein [Edaphosphingomonas haloaromaticamans]|uniref:Uncharacterized protein n=1 Tax=Edaphosphingomonas haloaromaticamans TaxID=653954 RepID=A0A1S1HEG4_9SPHN|nr:hypothetical protein [Sphingomonas haloaromaticamans]OHT18890.1 hypothetical protein BHE75_00869 [Sphingomonas haloaromaticamans]
MKPEPNPTPKAAASIVPPDNHPNDAFEVSRGDSEKICPAVAKALLAPDARHSAVIQHLLSAHFGKLASAPGLGDYSDALRKREDEAEKGDLALVSRTLAAQASTLDVIFAEMARRMALNTGEHLGATGIYARIALKAQASSRATLEALAKLHQPREQTVRHVHVNEGGQAVVADQFHHHAGGSENAKSAEQPHAPESGAAGTGSTLPCPDQNGEAVPVASSEGKSPLQDARRKRQRRA